jgi:hypothetical protein
VCDGRAGGATTDAWHQRPLAVTSAASQASDCVGRGHESVAAPTNTSVVLGRTHTLLDCVCWCDGRWGYSRQTRLLIGVLTVGTSNAQDTWRLRVHRTQEAVSVARASDASDAELENFPSTHLLAWLLILVRLSEIQVHCIESCI